MLSIIKKTEMEIWGERLGFILGALVFSGVFYFVFYKLTENLKIAAIILLFVYSGLILVSWINKKYKKWVL